MKKIANKIKQVGLILLFMAAGAAIWAHHNGQIKNMADDTKSFVHEKVYNSLQGVVDNMRP